MLRSFAFAAVFLGMLTGTGLAQSGDSLAEIEQTEFDPCLAAENSSLFKPLSEIKVMRAKDDKRLPPDCSSTIFEKYSSLPAREASHKVFHWEPTNFFHRPFYFDDVPLERYGQSTHPCLQPAISGARFYLTLPMMPYKMAIDKPFDCITTLGHQPPGNCIPCIKQTLPKQSSASLIEAATVVGLVLALP